MNEGALSLRLLRGNMVFIASEAWQSRSTAAELLSLRVSVFRRPVSRPRSDAQPLLNSRLESKLHLRIAVRDPFQADVGLSSQVSIKKSQAFGIDDFQDQIPFDGSL